MIKKVLIPIIGVLFFLVLITACKVENPDPGNGNGNGDTGEQYYVAVNGSDSDDGSSNAPWRTVQHGVNQLSPGDTLNIRSGTYREEVTATINGTADKKIYIKGASFQTTFLDGNTVARDLFFLENSSYVEISNLAFLRAPRAGVRLSYSDNILIWNCVFADHGRWGVFTDFSNYTTIQNCEAYGSVAEHGIYISNSSDNASIRNNFVHHNYASGVQINADPSMGGDGISSGCLIENNVIYENGIGGGAAINLASVRNSTIQNNVIYHNYAGGIAAWDDGQGLQWGSKNLTIIHNTVYFRSFEGRWALSLKNGSSDGRVNNNIFAGGARGGFEFNTNCLTGIDLDYNIYYRYSSPLVVTWEDSQVYTLIGWKGAGYDAHSVTEFPRNLFIDVLNGNHHLKSTAVAVDMGTDTGLKYDYEGTSRPQGAGPDVGADETI